MNIATDLARISFAAALLGVSLPAQDTLLETQKLTAAGGQFLDNFGRDVSVQGELALISAFADDDKGSATLFTQSGGVWTEGPKLTASDGVVGDGFGICALLSGNLILLGADQDDDGAPGSGSVYIFEDDGSGFSETGKLHASDPAQGDNFGRHLDLAGGVLVVGAPGKDEGAQDVGAAYVFTSIAGAWVQQQKLSPPSPEAFVGFGWDVATDGEVVLVTAATANAPASDSGAAYVYRFNGSVWLLEQMLTASDGAATEYFGWSGDVSGDVIAIGANNHDQPFSDSGAVYMFRWNGSSWIQEQKLTQSNAETNDRFGWSVAIEADRLVAGAAGHSGGDGAVYEFKHDGVQWVELHRLLSSDVSTGLFDQDLGLSVAIDGQTIFSGAPWGEGDETDVGAVYVYEVDSVLTYCAAKLSSAGCANPIATSDLANQPVSGADDYDVTCSLVQGFKNGLLFGGVSGPASIPFNGGSLCVNPPLKRGPILNSQGTGALTCDGSFATRVNNGVLLPAGLDAGPGNTAWYQYWYRDPQNGAGSFGTALSNALELSFL